MNVVLVSLNSKFIHSSLGVWYLYSAYKSIDTLHNVQIYESTINSHTEDIQDDIIKLKPDVIGFSCYIWNIEYVKKIAQNIKLILPDVKIFLGGPEASFDAENLIKLPYINTIVKGEGEESFIQLLKSDFNFDKEILSVPVSKYYNPYTQEYFDCLNGRIVYLETSRGCPFNCAFCLSGRDENVRFFDMDVSKENILKLANSGTQTVKFVDRTFNCNDKRAVEIFDFICSARKNGIIKENVVFHFEVEADLFTDYSLNYLKTVPAGLFQFEAGLQSFNKDTLKAVNRRHDTQKLVNNLKEIVKMGNIHLHIDLIAGLPFEDYDSFARGFDLAFDIHSQVIQLGFLKLLKGSPLAECVQRYGYVYSPYAPYQVYTNNFLSYEDMLKLKCAEDAVERIYNSARFDKTLEYVLEVTGLSAYKLFYMVGKHCKDLSLGAVSLDKYVSILYEYFSSLKNVDRQKLRDCMVLDKITTDKSGKISPCLHIADSNMKNINTALKNCDMNIFKNQTEKAKQALLGYAILYSGADKTAVVADYTQKNPVSGIYAYKLLSLDNFINMNE